MTIRSALAICIRKPRNAISKILKLYGYPTNCHQYKIWSLKNSYLNKRCFIVGMGPSLRIEDLDRIHREISFGCNKVYMAFENTIWRPDFYTISDSVIAESCAAHIKSIQSRKIFPDYTQHHLRDIDDIMWIKRAQASEYEPGCGVGFSEDLLEGIQPNGCTVIFDQLQIAFYMGFREVILIGVDFNYSDLKTTSEIGEQGAIVEAGHKVNYFVPDYCKPGEKMNLPKLDKQRKAFAVARKVYEKSGRRLLNASRRTALEELEKVNFDELF